MHLTTRLSRTAVGAALLVLATVAGALLLISRATAHPRSSPAALSSELSTFDPRTVIPTANQLPNGTMLSSFSYISTEQASHRNGIPIGLLRRAGREIGYDRDFQVPRYGDVEIEAVRFRTHGGMIRAYSYFLTMVPSANVPPPITLQGVGERGTLVLIEGGAFVEFMRGRYYVVITTVPATPRAVVFIEGLARSLDRRIRTFAARA